MVSYFIVFRYRGCTRADAGRCGDSETLRGERLSAEGRQLKVLPSSYVKGILIQM